MLSFVLFAGLIVCGYIVYSQCRAKDIVPARRPAAPPTPPLQPVDEIDEPPLHYRFPPEPIEAEVVEPPAVVPVPKPAIVVRHTPRHPKPRRHE